MMFYGNGKLFSLSGEELLLDCMEGEQNVNVLQVSLCFCMLMIF